MITSLPAKRISVILQRKTFIRVLPTRWRRKPASIEITSLSPYVYTFLYYFSFFCNLHCTLFVTNPADWLPCQLNYYHICVAARKRRCRTFRTHLRLRRLVSRTMSHPAMCSPVTYCDAISRRCRDLCGINMKQKISIFSPVTDLHPTSFIVVCVLELHNSTQRDFTTFYSV